MESVLSIQVVVLDYYMFPESHISQPSPVIRVYGSTDKGQRALVHIHKVYPYLFFRPESPYDTTFQSKDKISGYLNYFESKFNEELIKRKDYFRKLNKNNVSNSTNDHEKNQSSNIDCNISTTIKPYTEKAVYSLEVVQYYSIYGYQNEKQFFVKVLLYDPSDIKPLVSILENGILGTVMQPYEAHIPFLLQFTNDLNVIPMDWLNIGPGMKVRGEYKNDILFPPPNNIKSNFNLADSLSRQASTPSQQSRLSYNSPLNRKLISHVFQSSGSKIVNNNLTDIEDITTNKLKSSDINILVDNNLISDIFDGITSEMIFTPDTMRICKQHNKNESSGSDKSENHSAHTKTSVMDVEIDITMEIICNQYALKRSFGYELWEEENNRRIKRGLPPQEFPSPSYTNSNHMGKSLNQENYQIRFKNLYEKGKAFVNRTNKFASVNKESSDVITNDSIDEWLTQVDNKLKENEVYNDILSQAMASHSHEIIDKLTQLNQLDVLIDDNNNNNNMSIYINHDNIDISSDSDDDIDYNVCTNNNKLTRMLTQIKEDNEAILSCSQDHTHNVYGDSNKLSNNCNDTVTNMKVDNKISPQKVNNPKKVEFKLDDDVNEDNTMISNISKATLITSIGESAYSNNISKSIDSNVKRKRTLSNLKLSQVFKSRKSNKKIKNQQIHQAKDDFVEITDNSTPLIDKTISKIFDTPPDKCEEVIVDNSNDIISEYYYYHSQVSPVKLVNSESHRINSNIKYLTLQKSKYGIDITNLSFHSFTSSKPIVFGNKDDYQQYSATQSNNRSKSREIRYIGDLNQFNTSADNFKCDWNNSFNKIKSKNRKISPRRDSQNSRVIRFLFPTYCPPDPKSFKIENKIDDQIEINQKLLKNKQLKMLTSQVISPVKSNLSSNTFNMKHNEILNNNSTKIEKNSANSKQSRITNLSIEVFVSTRLNLLPNPKYDEITLICWSCEDILMDDENEDKKLYHGVISKVCNRKFEQSYQFDKTSDNLEVYVNSQKKEFLSMNLLDNTTLEIVQNELDLINAFICLLNTINPDLIISYDIERYSIGYIINRCKILKISDIVLLLSRIPYTTYLPNNLSFQLISDEEDENGGIFIPGRVIINLWRRIKSDVKLFSNNIQHVIEQVLNFKFPYYDFQQLTNFYNKLTTSYITVCYFQKLSFINLLLFNKLDLLRRYSESARLYHIDMTSVITRGSQYRVEASLLYRCKALGYILLTASRNQVANQAPMAVIPLVMEPKQNMETDPVVVLDFQSLYPSMMLAYNMCFTTCLGKLLPGRSGIKDTNSKLGVSNYPEEITASNIYLQTLINTDNSSLHNHYVCENGSVFCSKETKEGILPLILREILETRVMIKKAMKDYQGKEDKVLKRVLDARQLAIKLLANVTYGYTAAGFSGRMPMAELADGIVQSGRSTLEWTIKEVDHHKTWNAKVIYGDTDSVFILLPGRSKNDAFQLGEEITHYITSRSLKDVVLKFEKVYCPSFLVTKKRYVGNCYESINQAKPTIDAKGIEMIRSDSCNITRKIQENVLKILFQLNNNNVIDISIVKNYLMTQWTIMHQSNRKYLYDFIFFKEIKYGKYKNISSLPPGVILINKQLVTDEMAVPPYRWKVPYLVIYGAPKSLLNELIVSPYEYLSSIRSNSSYYLNISYYITKCINPAVNRILSLIGIDINKWYSYMMKPKKYTRSIIYENKLSNTLNNNKLILPIKRIQNTIQQSIYQYITTSSCLICSNDTIPKKSICSECMKSKQSSILILMHILNSSIDKEKSISYVCKQCSKTKQMKSLYSCKELIGSDCCQSIECNIFYERFDCIIKLEDYQKAIADIMNDDV